MKGVLQLQGEDATDHIFTQEEYVCLQRLNMIAEPSGVEHKLESWWNRERTRYSKKGTERGPATHGCSAKKTNNHQKLTYQERSWMSLDNGLWLGQELLVFSS
jgi:hypothetical protein